MAALPSRIGPSSGATQAFPVYALGPVGQDGVWLQRNSSGHSYEGGPSTLNDS